MLALLTIYFVLGTVFTLAICASAKNQRHEGTASGFSLEITFSHYERLMRIKASRPPSSYFHAMNAIEHPLDLREVPPYKRHPLIFKTWDELPTGGAVLLINDHDPLPLYHQFAAEYGGGFRWEYLQSGPTVWEVRVNKGEFVDPGFYPTKKQGADCCVKSHPIEFVKPRILDTRPIFARGQTPCDAIDEAVADLIPGQPLVLLVPFEPVPLYAKLRQQGFSHKPAKFEDDIWRVEFRKEEPTSGAKFLGRILSSLKSRDR